MSGDGVQLYNTRTRRKERFEPLEEGHARIYTCGPTVYSPQHIGTMRPNMFADLLRRALEWEGLRVTHVINITDVGHLTDDADMGEDKIGRRAREMGIQPMEVAETFTRSYFEDMDALNV